MADAAYYLAQFEELRRQFEQQLGEDRPLPSVVSAVRYLGTYVDSAWVMRGAAADVHQFQRLAARAALELLNWPQGANVWLDEIERRGLGVETKDDPSNPDDKRITIADCVLSSIRLCEKLATAMKRASAPSETPAEALERLRQECGWTIEDLAIRSDVSERAVREHLKSITNISPDVRHRYCAAFELELGRPIPAATFAPLRTVRP